MIINGLQKLTLLDFPGKTACTVFLGGCNYACPFCHNAPLALPGRERDEIGEEELLSFLKKRQGLLEGVCITGGEPTLRRDLPEFISKIKALGYLVKLDTNGTRPEMIRELLDKGVLDYIAMDIKAPVYKYDILAGVENAFTDKVLQSIELIKNSGIDREFRTTVTDELHTAEDIAAIAGLIKGEKRYFLQPYKDSGDIICPGFTPPSGEKLAAFMEAGRKAVPDIALRAE